MNRSILIVICDFLLVSLLAFSSADINKAVEEGVKPQMKLEMATNQPDSGKDLTAVMKLALEQERKGRDQLLGELTRTREEAARQQALVQERDRLLQERQRQVESFQQQAQNVQQALQTKEQLALQLQQAQTNLQQQFAAAQTNLLALNQQLQTTTAEASLSKEKLAELEAEARKKAEQAAALQQQLAQLNQSNLVVLAEKEKLAGQLKVAEVEKRNAAEQASRMENEVKVEREEKAKLVENVKMLASKSGELAKEVRENRPLAANTIFNEFLTNRVAAHFVASRPGLLGEGIKRKETETVLVTNGTNTFALCHVQDTPLSLFNPGTEWDGLTGTLERNTAMFPIPTLIFFLQDPRIIMLPVTADQARQLGCKVYRISTDPFKFQDAVLVGAREGYYGECKFEIDLSTPGYVRLDHNFLKGLFGKFNPSRGDLVFSKTGELLGVMANGGYCMMLQSFDGAARFTLGPDVRDQHTGTVLSQLYAMVTALPPKLQ